MDCSCPGEHDFSVTGSATKGRQARSDGAGRRSTGRARSDAGAMSPDGRAPSRSAVVPPSMLAGLRSCTGVESLVAIGDMSLPTELAVLGAVQPVNANI